MNNSPLFNIFNPGPHVQTGNPVLNFLGNMPGGQNALASVQQLMQQTHQSPEQIVKGMLQSGQISQDQFNRAVQILADNAAQTVALEQYLNPTPKPAYIVQNPNCCTQNNCGF